MLGNDTSSDYVPIGQLDTRVEANLFIFPGMTGDEITLGTFEFTKASSEATKIYVSVYEIGGDSPFDYPVGFTIDV